MTCSNPHALFLSKKLALSALTMLVYIIFLAGVFVFLVHPARYNIWLLFISQSLLCFLTLFYFLPSIKTWERGVLYCAFIPYINCIITYMTHHIVTHIAGLRLPFYFKGYYGIFESLFYMNASFGLLPYLMGFWIISIPLLIIYFFDFNISKFIKKRFEGQKILPPHPLQGTVSGIWLFKHKKITLATIIAYYIYMVLYCRLLKHQWNDYGPGDFSSAIHVCLLSFLSFLYLAPAAVGKTIKSIFYCTIIPFFWSTMIYVIYAAVVFVFLLINTKPINTFRVQIGDNAFPLDGIFSIKFFLLNYIVIQGWFISIALLLMYVIYYYYVKTNRVIPKHSISEDGAT